MRHRYWISALLKWMTFNKRSEIDLCWFIMVSILNIFANLPRTRISFFFRSLYILLLYTTSLFRYHTLSMMFRSGLRADQIKTAILFDFRNSNTFCSVATRIVLPQTHQFWPNCPWHHRIKMVCSSSRYFNLLYLTSITFITRLPKQEKAPKIISPPPPIWLGAMTLSPLCSMYEVMLSGPQGKRISHLWKPLA